MLGVPAGLVRERLDEERVDLGQGVVSREPPERVRKPRVAPGVVQGVTGLVQKRLVVGEAALGASDQVDDAGGVGGDDARPGVLLRAIVEVEPDPLVGGKVEAELRERRQADGHRSLLRVGAGQRGEPPDVGDVSGRGLVLALLAEDHVEPALAQVPVGRVDRRGGLLEHVGEPVQVDLLSLGAATNRILDARELRLERLPGLEERQALVVEARRGLDDGRAEPVADRVLVDHGERSLRRAQRHLLAAVLDTAGEDRVLEGVQPVGELGHDDAALARVAEPGEAFPLVAVADLGVLQGGVLVAGEERAVAGDDRRLLARVLLTDPDGPRLLGGLVEVAGELALERVGCQRVAHRGRRSSDPYPTSELLPSKPRSSRSAVWT